VNFGTVKNCANTETFHPNAIMRKSLHIVDDINLINGSKPTLHLN